MTPLPKLYYLSGGVNVLTAIAVVEVNLVCVCVMSVCDDEGGRGSPLSNPRLPCQAAQLSWPLPLQRYTWGLSVSEEAYQIAPECLLKFPDGRMQLQNPMLGLGPPALQETDLADPRQLLHILFELLEDA